MKSPTHFDLNNIFAPAKVEFVANYNKINIVIDLDALQTINSERIKAMVVWFREIQENNKIVKVTFLNARPAFIHQLIVLKNLVPRNVFIASLYVPFYCERCFLDHLVHVHAKTLIEEKSVGPAPVCSGCGLDMEIEVPLEDYLSILKEEMLS